MSGVFLFCKNFRKRKGNAHAFQILPHDERTETMKMKNISNVQYTKLTKQQQQQQCMKYTHHQPCSVYTIFCWCLCACVCVCLNTTNICII